MSESNETLSVLLSREEVLCVLSTVQAALLPGIDPDPQAESTSEYAAAMLLGAERALRARGLARLVDGKLQLHSDLLEMVGTCAYSDNALLVYHWGANETSPTRLFGHVRDRAVVAHTRPDPVLHLFAKLPTKMELVTRVLRACVDGAGIETNPHAFVVTPALLRDVRELAEQNKRAAAVTALTMVDVSSVSAEKFVKLLASQPATTIVQALTTDDGTVTKRDFTLLQHDETIWLIGMGTAAEQLNVQTISTQALNQLFNQLL